MRILMGLLGSFASLLGTSCSKKPVHVEFVNSNDNSVFAASDLSPDQLPETFAIATTLEIKGEKWSVDSAEPAEKSKFAQTGKLRVVVSKLTTVNPRDLLYSLATIADDLGAVNGDALPSPAILALHEDDWRQIEFVSESFSPAIEQELNDIRQIHQTQRKGMGFKNLHIRKRIPAPFTGCKLALQQLETELRPQLRFDAVGFYRTRGTIPRSFAWHLDKNLILWGTVDAASNVERLCVLGSPEPESISRIVDSFVLFNGQHKLNYVDWCRLTSIGADKESFSRYFQKAQ